MLVLGVILLGFISFGRLGTDLFPDLNNPRIFIEIDAGERPPEEVEKQFVESIEANAIRQKNVSQISSVTRVGAALITVEYNWDTDMDKAFLDLQKALNTFSQNSELENFSISRHNPNARPIMLVAMKHSEINDMNELRKVAENYIRNELIRLEGVADIQLSGEQESELVISTNDHLLKAYNLNADMITTKIQSYNRNVSGGSVVDKGMQYIVKGISLLETKKDFEQIIVSYKTNPNTPLATDRIPVFLKDVATISIKNKEPRNIVHINGERCIGLSIYKETKFNTVKAVEDLEKAFAEIQQALPAYKFTVVQNQGTFISDAIGEVEETALPGIVFAVFVLFLFLRRIGTTIIVSIAIPISIIATFNLMYFNNLSLNIMTLGGLALGAGMLVDNAIVVLENIFRNVENGMTTKEAAIEGTAEVGGAITASTITTIVVFLPIVYLQGSAGELFKEQAWTVAFSLLSSLFVAILVIPVLFNTIFKNRKKIKPLKQTIKFTAYERFLSKVLEKRILVIVVATLLIATAVAPIPVIGSEYMPKSQSNEFLVELKMSEGTNLERTESAISNIERLINDVAGSDIEFLYSHAGPGTSGNSANTVFEDENTAYINVILHKKHKKTVKKIIAQLSQILDNIPEVDIQFSQNQSALQEVLGTDEAPLIVEVAGNNLQTIEELSGEVKGIMEQWPDIFNVKTSIEEGAPEIEVEIDRYRAGLYGITIESITSQIKDKLSGKTAGKYDNSGELTDIVLKFPETGLHEFQNMLLANGNLQIRLDEVANIHSSYSPKEIHRRNQNRIGKITAEVNPQIPFDHIVNRLETKLSEINIPPDYNIQMAGEEKKRRDSMSSLSFALLLSVVLVYMVMASQFESLVHPFTILLTIPLAVVGAVFAFFLLGLTFNIMAYIGVIMLGGIAVNDSIVLVDRINQLKRSGLHFDEAIKQAAHQRIRPIIMTSLTTILALLPLTFGFGESAALRTPMAVAVIGGLVTSTLLSLVVIPCVYYVFDDILFKLKRN